MIVPSALICGKFIGTLLYLIHPLFNPMLNILRPNLSKIFLNNWLLERTFVTKESWLIRIACGTRAGCWQRKLLHPASHDLIISAMGGRWKTNKIQYSLFLILILVIVHGCSSLNLEGRFIFVFGNEFLLFLGIE